MQRSACPDSAGRVHQPVDVAEPDHDFAHDSRHRTFVGQIARDVAVSRNALAGDLRDGRRKLLGVTDFKPTDDTPPETAAGTVTAAPETRLPGPDSKCPPLNPWRYEEALS